MYPEHTMSCVVSLLVILNLYLNVLGTDNSHNIIRWNVTEQFKGASSFDLPKTGVILKNKPLHIVLANYDASPINAGCKSKLFGQHFETSSESKKEDGKDNLIIKINHVTDAMSTKWECWAWIPNSKKYQYLTFKIRIKGLERVRVTVGGLELTHNQTEPSQVEYDGVAEYWYKDGEVVDLVCTRHTESIQEGYIRLTYYNTIDEVLLETDEIPFNYPINFRKPMHDGNKDSYVDCTYTSKAKIKYTYRTIFKLKSETTSLNPFKITVNDLKLVPARPDSVRAEYQYKFYEGQILTITCETDQHLLTNLSLRFDVSQFEKNFIKETETVPWRITKQLNTSIYLDRKYLRCVSNDNLTQYSAELLLLLEQIEPMILGLYPSDVIHQYNKKFATWVTDYQYTVNQTLNLTCVARKPNQWIISNNSVESHITSRGPDRNHLFVLKEEHKGTSIICDTLHGRAVLNLHVKPDLGLDYIFKDEERMIIVGSAVVVSAVALVTVCFMIWCRLRRNKGVRQESSENLTRVLETPIPTYPSQWDISEDNINTQEDLMVNNSLYAVDCAPLYARPQKKAKFPTEPLYQSIEPVYNVPTSEGVDDVTVVNNVTKSVPQGVNLTYSNARGDEEHSQLGNNKETYDYVSSSNTSTRDYVEPLYSEVVWPQ